MLEISMGDDFLLLLAAACLGGAVAFLLLRRRMAREAREAALLAARPGPGTATEARKVPRGLLPLVEAARANAADLRARLDRLTREHDAALTALSRLGKGVIVTDRNGVVLRVSGTQPGWFQSPDRDAVGRPFIEVVQDHEVNEVVRRCLADGRSAGAVVETVPGRSYLSIIAAPAGGDGGCVVILDDLSELRRLEKVRREFVANISHELRTPLASLKLLSETLSSGGAEDAVLLRDYLARIEVEVDRLAQMVDELGELSLLETGQVSLERKAISVAELVHTAVGRLEAQAERAELRLAVSAPEDLPLVKGDARRLEQALVNLLHNAIKFTPPGGAIGVAARLDPGEVAVSVSDTGVGIQPEDLERIFERFYKADRSRSGQGTGLGLAIVRHIVRLHGGRVWAESQPGAGATFTFTLPVESERA